MNFDGGEKEVGDSFVPPHLLSSEPLFNTVRPAVNIASSHPTRSDFSFFYTRESEHRRRRRAELLLPT